MKQSEMMRHLMSGERTPYYDAKARKSAYHEAGHVVVAHSIGWPVVQVSLVQAQLVPQGIHEPLLARSRKERSRRIAGLRRGLSVLAAGHVAGTIHQQEVDRKGYSSPQERRAYSTWWEFRASGQIRSDSDHIRDPHNDSCRLAQEAGRIRFVLALDSEGTLDQGSVLAEVQQAEGRAERVLKRHWQAVSDIAAALHRSKSGVLKGKRVREILAPHFEPQAVS